jgi:hypothetical protein
MSGPFTEADSRSQPIWSVTTAPSGNFSPFPTISAGTDEVGYGKGGYGIGGYDAPGTPIQAAPTPIWTIEVVR